jgi:hypothetical protein
VRDCCSSWNPIVGPFPPARALAIIDTLLLVRIRTSTRRVQFVRDRSKSSPGGGKRPFGPLQPDPGPTFSRTSDELLRSTEYVYVVLRTSKRVVKSDPWVKVWPLCMMTTECRLTGQSGWSASRTGNRGQQPLQKQQTCRGPIRNHAQSPAYAQSHVAEGPQHGGILLSSSSIRHRSREIIWDQLFFWYWYE